MSFNMATKKVNFISAEQVLKMPEHLTCEKIEATARDMTHIPMVMVYDKRYYSDSSAYIICNKGAESNKDDLAFQPSWLSMTDRGFVLAFPMLRGKSKIFAIFL
jgi:protease II